MSVATLPAESREALPPGPRFRNPLRFFGAFRRDPIAMLTEASRRSRGRLACLLRPPLPIYAIPHPDHVRHVFLAHPKRYGKGAFSRKLAPVFGNGLVFSEGSFWRRQRMLSAPAFYPARIEGYADAMVSETSRLLDEWEARAARGEAVVDVADEMPRLTLDVVGRVLLGLDFRERATDFFEVTTRVVEYASYQLNTLLPLPRWIPTARNRRILRDLAYIRATVDGVIAERRADRGDGRDLLSSLLAARDDETHEGMTDEQLRDELVTFVGAGSETTALALAWTFVLLSRHPDVREALHDEVDGVLGGRAPALADLERLPYLRCVAYESLRLYPPAWGIGRESVEDDEIDGYRIRRGTGLLASPWVTHRLPELWDEPEAFRPERFTPENSRGRPRFAWWPFGAGPRVCIGREFALAELQLVLASVVQRFTLDLVEGHPIVPWPVFTTRLLHGAPMRLARRGG